MSSHVFAAAKPMKCMMRCNTTHDQHTTETGLWVILTDQCKYYIDQWSFYELVAI